MISYNEQWNKLTTAYINNEVQPYIACACFIGNLLNNTSTWMDGRLGFDFKNNKVDGIQELPHVIRSIKRESKGTYTQKEIYQLELLFLKTISDETKRECCDADNYEDALFKAFELTLDLLKEIHLSKGEIVEEVPQFKQRKINQYDRV